MKKYFLSLITFCCLYTTTIAQNITGNWYGTLTAPNINLPLVFHIEKNGDGYVTTMDSPAQGAKDIFASRTTFTDNLLEIELNKFNIKYKGVFLPDSNKITGTFTQGGGDMKLNLFVKKEDAMAKPPAIRPQDPKEFPYKQEEVTFINSKAGNQLAGTLTMPANGKITKIVIMITGSGPQNRNEEIFNHRPFLVWSDWLTRQGIATLRYDDRGVGKSTGNYGTATTYNFADDVEAAINYIHSRADLKSFYIGLMGHSEGGLIAPMVANHNAAVKFLVLLAAPGVPMDELLLKQTSDQMRLKGVSPKTIEENTAINRRIYETVMKNEDTPTPIFKAKLDTILRRELIKNTPADMMDFAVLQTEKSVATSWFRHVIALKPADYLAKIHCPVLALNGTLDMQVNSTANLAGIKAALQKANNKNHQEIAMESLNHLFQQVKTGSTEEYGETTETVNPVALQKVSAWIINLK